MNRFLLLESSENNSQGNHRFKVNAEKTRQQYSTQKEQPKWNHKGQQNNSRHSSEQNKSTNKNPSSNDRPDRGKATGSTTSTKQNKQQSKQNKNKNDSDAKPSKTKGKKTKPPKTAAQSSTETGTPSDKNIMDHDTSADSIPHKVYRILKQILIIFACFVLMILLFGLKFSWQILRTILKYTILLVLWVVSK